jgi:hypothetical protein
VDSAGPVVHDHAVRSEEIIASGRGADHQGRNQTTCDRLQEDVEDRVDECSDCACVGGEVFEAEGVGGGQEGWAVTCLCSVEVSVFIAGRCEERRRHEPRVCR